MPYNEKHQLQIRVDGFNVTNTQHFCLASTGTAPAGRASGCEVSQCYRPPNWSNFTNIQGNRACCK